MLGGEDIAMFNTANREAAWKFMQFMTGEYAETAMAKCGQIPVNKAALESDTVKNADRLAIRLYSLWIYNGGIDAQNAHFQTDKSQNELHYLKFSSIYSFWTKIKRPSVL